MGDSLSPFSQLVTNFNPFSCHRGGSSSTTTSKDKRQKFNSFYHITLVLYFKTMWHIKLAYVQSKYKTLIFKLQVWYCITLSVEYLSDFPCTILINNIAFIQFKLELFHLGSTAQWRPSSCPQTEVASYEWCVWWSRQVPRRCWLSGQGLSMQTSCHQSSSRCWVGTAPSC